MSGWIELVVVADFDRSFPMGEQERATVFNTARVVTIKDTHPHATVVTTDGTFEVTFPYSLLISHVRNIDMGLVGAAHGCDKPPDNIQANDTPVEDGL